MLDNLGCLMVGVASLVFLRDLESVAIATFSVVVSHLTFFVKAFSHHVVSIQSFELIYKEGRKSVLRVFGHRPGDPVNGPAGSTTIGLIRWIVLSLGP